MFSIAIPTHNRCHDVTKLAAVLDTQECDVPSELIFVLDGCTDNTYSALSELRLGNHIKLIETPGLGAAGARNAGAKVAQGDWLLFIDDDVIPQPGLLAAHADMHKGSDALAAVGPYPYAPEMPVNPLDFFARQWWGLRFETIAEPNHVFTYRDCLTGNFSITKSLFDSLGGFDEAFEKSGREDYEFGARLLKSGAEMKYARGAQAYHYPTNKPSTLLHKWYTYGGSDILISRKHPEVFGTLPVRKFCRKHGFLDSLLRESAYVLTLNPKLVVAWLGRLFDRNLHNLWHRRMLALWGMSQQLCYFLGLVSAIGGPREFRTYLNQYMEKAEWPKYRVGIYDLDLSTPLPQIAEADASDYGFASVRASGRVLGWAGLPCQSGQDSISTCDLGGTISEQLAWSIWQNTVIDSPANSELTALAAWGSLIGTAERLPSIPCIRIGGGRQKTQSEERILALCFPEDGRLPQHDFPVRHYAMDPSQDGSSLDALNAAMADADYVGVFRGSDEVDTGWADSALCHFSNRRTDCVVTPVVPRSIHTRGDELFSIFTGLSSVRTWSSSLVTQWMHPARILYNLGAPCRRLVIRKDILLKYFRLDDLRAMPPERIHLAILHRLLHEERGIVYEPRSLVWRSPGMGVGEVRRMAEAHIRRIESMCLKGTLTQKSERYHPSRIRGKLIRIMLRKTCASALGKLDWPLTMIMAEWQGLLSARKVNE